MIDDAKHLLRLEEVIMRKSAEFLVRNLPSTALVTVTGCALEKNNTLAIVFITVLPEKAVEEVLRDTKRLRSDLRDYLRKNTKIGNVPNIDIMLSPDYHGDTVV